jgi:hypothetical protein
MVSSVTGGYDSNGIIWLLFPWPWEYTDEYQAPRETKEVF